ncbi:MAG: electron transfer flavoprotein subunit beta/FixA family protein [Natronospirillum sp.]|uniref:electron transfer flavoprotein subunit beta/FixA family protein n=1 Tax=Natronospirillum sp. TaxID=2812955 RepID=UPI0025EF7408|nr:electron transfer flavoprotein subunit beta/FixA family protein [Natronospirillum sp.]MCH8553201.1 electron transfer flavoprotein subunit beta/FixA family protein [Natronospirillum sp.]
MKIVVPVKRVIDAYVKVRVKSDGSGVDTENVKMALNPFDEIALEAAMRLKESGQASEVVAVTAGPEAAQQQLRTALAMGADRALHIDTPADIQPLAVARLLVAICDREQPDLVLMGKQAIDDDANQVGQMLAALQGWAQGTFISALEPGEGEVLVTREVDSGHERLALPLPAVVTVDLRLNEPRYPKLPDIMKAKKKPIEGLTPEELAVDISTGLSVLKVEEPPARVGGARVNSVAELVEKLQQEAKVI